MNNTNATQPNRTAVLETFACYTVWLRLAKSKAVLRQDVTAVPGKMTVSVK